MVEPRAFFAYVDEVTDGLRAGGWITAAEERTIERVAARSRIGKT